MKSRHHTRKKPEWLYRQTANHLQGMAIAVSHNFTGVLVLLALLAMNKVDDTIKCIIYRCTNQDEPHNRP